MRRLALLLATLLSLPLPSQAPPTPPVPPATARPVTLSQLEDGPYVLWQDHQAQVLRIHQGQVASAALPANRQLALAGLPDLVLDERNPEPEPCVLPMPSRIAAVSDIHGNYTGLVTLLRHQGIMNDNNRWSFGTGHLVVVGDTFDRGPGVTESLWLLRSLQDQARQARGAVHVLLGNHEAMTLAGDLRYLNGKYRTLPAVLGRDYLSLFGPTSELGRWVRSRNAMMTLGDILFVHGGISPALAEQGLDFRVLNEQLRQGLGTPRKALLLAGGGPLWYRGLVPGAEKAGDASEAQITAILKAAKARLMVIGHTTQPQVTALHGGRVFAIDANLQEAAGELWLYEKGKAYRGLPDGTRIELP